MYPIKKQLEFWKKVNKRGPFPKKYTKLRTRCWLWLGYKYPSGYGQIGRPNRLVHRVSWEIHKGTIKKDIQVLHKCDNRSCVRPSHLFVGSQIDNIVDMCTKDRQAKGKKHSDATIKKMSSGLARKIKKMYATGEYTQSSLGKLFGVSQFLVSLIVRNKLIYSRV